ncbi:porin [Paraburkholderia pallida]|uniref:Porin n=1 Tax=Paraburkholderia pallida TaxID=2547399 RepID=A0A4P7CZ04_9BURK|nr:porin [Paraburkholderia pallida]QBR01561.1 porin [Paraburkholderia pallida]
MRIRVVKSSLKTIATALMLASANASWAQSSVTLYGTVDGGLLYLNKTGSEANQRNNGSLFGFTSSGLSPSIFGLLGHEDLGGGYKANFNLVSGISIANGGFDNTNGNLFGRQAWVSISSPYGEAAFGLQYSPFEVALFESDPRSFSQFGSSIVVYADNVGTGTFVSNAITWSSPTVAGFTARALVALGGVAGDFRAGFQYSGSLKYQFGGLMLNAAILDESQSDDKALNLSAFTMPVVAKTFGAAYNFSSVTVKASFTTYDAPRLLVGGARFGGANHVYNAGLIWHALPQLDVDAGAWYIRDPHESANHAITSTLGTTYYLSKNTSLYAQFGVTDNHGNESIGLTVENGGLVGAKGTTVGLNTGIKHTF